jgi:glycerophosphoryl diester phosphodiesterase
LQQAADLGASLCEIDLRRTRDGGFVVFHDDILDNASTGKGLISQLDYAEIAKFRTRSRNGLVIEGQPIELFEDILVFSRDLGIGLIVEIKDKFEDNDYLPQVISALRDTRMLDQVLVSSFDYVVLRDIKRLEPRIRTMGINYHHLTEPAAAALSASMDVMNTDYPQFGADLAKGLHEAGVGVSHYVPPPKHFQLRASYGENYLERLEGYMRSGLVDMLVCDDVAWTMDFVRSCGLTVTRIDAVR